MSATSVRTSKKRKTIEGTSSSHRVRTTKSGSAAVNPYEYETGTPAPRPTPPGVVNAAEAGKRKDINKLVLTLKIDTPDDDIVATLKEINDTLRDGKVSSLDFKEELILVGAPAAIVKTIQTRMNKKVKVKEEEETVGDEESALKVAAEIQRLSCSCLTELTNNFNRGVCATILSGGVEAITEVLKAFPNTLEVQRSGLQALMNTLPGSPPVGSEKEAKYSESVRGDNKRVADLVVKKGMKFVEEDCNGADLIAKAMNAFPNDLDLQVAGCGLFNNLATIITISSPRVTKEQSRGRVLLLKAGTSAVADAVKKYVENFQINLHAKGFWNSTLLPISSK